MHKSTRCFWLALTCFATGSAQNFIAGLGGTAAISNAATVDPRTVSSGSYNARVGPAFNFEAGRHLNDWISFQGGYQWNRNRISTSEITGATFRGREFIDTQHALGADAMLYFRSRDSRIRPYLSGGPAWVRAGSRNTAGFRTAVGVDLKVRHGWGVRYSFSEMISPNPLAKQLNPPGAGKLMNFQNLFGFSKTF